MATEPGRRLARPAATIAALALAPAAALPEGAVKLLDCEFARLCDAAGECAPESGHSSFRMEPVELGSGGTGRYTISYDDTSADMQALSDAGPFVWNVARERNALIASSETEWLWHRLTLVPEPASEIRFLVCAFQQ